MKNLFSTSIAADLLQPGKYTLELMAIRPGKGRAYDGKAPKDTITFCFRETKTNAPVNRTVSATRDPRGRLMEFVRQMAGEVQPQQDDTSSGEALTRFLDTLLNRLFDSVIAISENGRFNNIVSISPRRENTKKDR